MNSRDAAVEKSMKKAAMKVQEKEPAYKRSYNAETVIILLLALIAAFFLRTYVFQNTRVDGSSMYPTFFTDEQVFVEKLSYIFSEPERSDILICRYGDESAAVIKRVIGLPGETVEIAGGEIYIDGELLDESAYWNDVIYSDMPPVTVPEDHVFVVGDNRNASLDSRSTGPVPYYRIIGKAQFVIWPFENFGRLPD